MMIPKKRKVWTEDRAPKEFFIGLIPENGTVMPYEYKRIKVDAALALKLEVIMGDSKDFG